MSTSTPRAPADALAPAARRPFFAHCPACEGSASAPVVAFPELTFVRCQACGLIYKQEQVPNLGRGYESDYFSAGNHKYLRRWAHRVRKCRRQLEATLEFAPAGAGAVLDVGCSAGYVLEAARGLGLDAQGLDFSQYAVDLCQQRGYRATQGSLTELPFPDASFDVVMLKAVLEHVPDPLQGLREVTRVLRPGGAAFVIVPDGDYFKHALMPRTCRDFRPDARGWQHHVYFHTQSFQRACARVGLRVAHEGRDVLRRRPPSRWPWPLEHLRFTWLAAQTAVARATHLRRDLQAIVVRDPA